MVLNHKPSVSVIIPCYNASKFIRETLASVLTQKLKPIEILLIDDGSTDNSAIIAKDFDSSIRIIWQENQGAGIARNKGIEAAKGEWTAFLDADDIWEPEKLETQMAAIEAEEDIICCHTGFYMLEEDFSKTPVNTIASVLNQDYRIETLLLEPLINTSTAVIRTDSPVRFPDCKQQGEDMMFFTELSEHGRFYFVPKPLAGYRRHPQQITRRDINAWSAHFRNRFNWVDANVTRIGEDRADNLRMLLRRQVIDWLNLARWNRQWHRYEDLRKYAKGLDWPDGLPRALHERLYPRSIYQIKDIIDQLLNKRWHINK